MGRNYTHRSVGEAAETNRPFLPLSRGSILPLPSNTDEFPKALCRSAKQIAEFIGATHGGLWNLETEAPTPEEAIEKLRELIDGRLRGGAEVLGLEILSRPHPLARFAGVLRDKPLLGSWKEAMAEYRQETEDR